MSAKWTAPRIAQAPPPTEVNQKLVDQYTEIAQLAGGPGARDQEPAVDHRAEYRAVGRGSGRRTVAHGLAGPWRKIAVVQRECQRLQDLLNDFLAFARVRKPRLESSDLNEEVRRLLDFFRPKAEEAKIEVVYVLAVRPAGRALGPRDVSKCAVEPGDQRPAGHARWRPTGGQHTGDLAGRRPALDRHRLRHGRPHAVKNLSGFLFHQVGRLGPGFADFAEKSSNPTAAQCAWKASPAAARNSRSNCPCRLGWVYTTGRRRTLELLFALSDFAVGDQVPHRPPRTLARALEPAASGPLGPGFVLSGKWLATKPIDAADTLSIPVARADRG